MAPRETAGYLAAQFAEGQRRLKALAAAQHVAQRQTQGQHEMQHQVADHGLTPLAAQIAVAEHVIIKTVQEKVQQVGHDGLAALGLDDFHCRVVGLGMKL